MAEELQPNFLKQWGALIVAVVALIQPWVSFLYKKYFKLPVVMLFKAGKVEIGYSNFGPTIGLNGTMKVEHKDVFIRAINIRLVRGRDQSTHDYEWSVFRSNKIRLLQQRDIELELAAGFMLTTSQAQRYNILFVENKAQQELTAELEKIREAWNSFVWPKLIDRIKENPNITSDQYRAAIYEEFSKEPVHVETWTKIDRARYWEAGSYSLTMTVKTSDPEKEFVSKWAFSLQDAEVKLLSYNSAEILRMACSVGTDTWNFAYCAYE